MKQVHNHFRRPHKANNVNMQLPFVAADSAVKKKQGRVRVVTPQKATLALNLYLASTHLICILTPVSREISSVQENFTRNKIM